MEFQKSYSLEDRKNTSQRIKDNFPNRIPVIVSVGDKKNMQLNKHKFITTNDITLGQFLSKLRQQIKCNEKQAIYINTDKGIFPPISILMQLLYDKHKNDDGFLYLVLNQENTFG